MSNVQAITNKIATDSCLRRTIFRYIFIILIVLSSTYLYLIVSITFNVLARKSLENTVAEMNNRIGNLEVSYLALSSLIDRNLVASLGFVDANNNIIVTRTADRVALR